MDIPRFANHDNFTGRKNCTSNDSHLQKSKKNFKNSDPEHAYVSAEVALLLQAVPRLKEMFQIKKKIGEGTFSSVFLAKFKDSYCSDGVEGKYVALKYIVPTSHPSRIVIELECMQKFGNSANVIGILSCIREGNNVVMVMPYFSHDKFTDYVGKLELEEIRDYMRKLLEALCVVHRGGVIHRDVKPSNFLYNRKLRRYALVDFGLSQRAPLISSSSRSNTGHSHFSRKEEPLSACQVSSSKTFVKLLPPPISSSSSHHQFTIRGRDSIKSRRENAELQICDCNNLSEVCRTCLSKPVQVASRAGTPGFRPPEVLLKHPYQTTAIDVWSAGVIFLCLLSGRYPFFHGLDDVTALAEIATLVGSASIKQIAAKLGKVVVSSPEKPAMDLRVVCKTLRPKLTEVDKTNGNHLSAAFDLLEKMLNVDFEYRISALEALAHPFISLHS